MHLLTWAVHDEDANKLIIRLQLNATATNYAILSHTWGKTEDEVSYDDMVGGRPEEKKGYEKVLGCCRQAHSDGLDSVWIDTCCINKDSSAELSEAITSMYSYYEQSKLCYVFLDDVSIDHTDEDDEKLLLSSLSRSRWFTRGWTLQELIAPKRVKFFNQSWDNLGYKTDPTLSRIIEKITKIDTVVLRLPAAVRVVSIAKRMSWAARRKTTRIEDRAYSLMGLFGVHMPPIYGEGIHAFIRLHAAILSTSTDHSIFAWTYPPKEALTEGHEHVSTMLALSPDQFEYSFNFKPIPQNAQAGQPHGLNKFDYTITNVGLAIRLPLMKIEEIEGLYAAFLACTESEDRLPAAIVLRTSSQTPLNHFWRTNSNVGPIERDGRLWFPRDGRHVAVPQDVHILPRLTSVSADNIEPSWKKNSKSSLQIVNSWRKKSSLAFNDDIWSNLRHVPDPSFDQLELSQKVRHLILANKPNQLFQMAQGRPNFDKYLPSRDPYFHGQEAILKKLREYLSLSETSPSARVQRSIKSCVLSGHGGIGKTSVAVEFSHICKQYQLFDEVLWIPADSDSRAYGLFRQIATELNLVETAASQDNVEYEVLHWLSNSFETTWTVGSGKTRPPQWLFVFDNARSASIIRRFWPLYVHCSVLITSQNSNLWYKFDSEHISLESFSVKESMEALRKRTGIDDDDDFTPLAKHLDGLPLAISNAGSFIAHNQLSANYIAHTLGTTKANLLSPTLDDLSTIKSVFSSALRQLPISSRALLQVIAFLDPEFISDSILVPLPTTLLASYPRNHGQLFQSRQRLIELSLVSRSSAPAGINVHRSLPRNVLGLINPCDFPQALATAIELAHSALADANSKSDNKESDTQHEDILPHIPRLREFAARLEVSEEYMDVKAKLSELLKFAAENESPAKEKVA